MEQALFPYAAGLASILFAALIGIVGWVGNQIKNELGNMGEKVDRVNQTLSAIERDLRGELSALDRRVTRIEERCTFNHDVA